MDRKIEIKKIFHLVKRVGAHPRAGIIYTIAGIFHGEHWVSLLKHLKLDNIFK